MLYYVLYGLVLFRKGDFHYKNASRMIFEGRILGGTRNFRGDPYLSGTIDKCSYCTSHIV